MLSIPWDFQIKNQNITLDEVENGGIAMFVETTFTDNTTEADSSADISSSGEVLDGQGNGEQLLHSDGTTPRVKTENFKKRKKKKLLLIEK